MIIFGKDAGARVCRLRRARTRRLGVDRVIKSIRKKSHCFAFSEHEIITLEPGPTNGLYATMTSPCPHRCGGARERMCKGGRECERETTRGCEMTERERVRMGLAGRPRRIS